jgi:hypothetical protein
MSVRWLAATLILCFACGQPPAGPTPADPTQGPSTNPASAESPPMSSAPSGMTEVFVGAGDIATCDPNAEATARLLDSIGGTVFTLGDHAYPLGAEPEFRQCYDPTWGRHKGRTRPTPGNHDYQQRGAGTYFEYFGVNAGLAAQGYYSFELGSWLALSLNSSVNIPAQVTWLKNVLGRSRSRCTIAYWHEPLYSSGPNPKNDAVRDLWQVLYENGAEVVLNGHDHFYERFAPQDDAGRLDPTNGIRQFIVGTGGAGLHPAMFRMPNSEVLIATFGVLKLTLFSDGYDWEFIPVSGQRDNGSGRCHDPLRGAPSRQIRVHPYKALAQKLFE